ncbi:MAG: Membrane protein involved in colicin uptake [Candidatus Saccharibacteria bacterium]|nr:Membrane protein involved in colicin uptake [Candidatus Saccharibacteria bacterium]
MSEVEQTTEVHETTTDPNGVQVRRQNVSRTTQPSGVVVAQRFIWFIAGVIDALIAIRFVLLLLGANQSAGFVDFIYGISSVLVAPFVGIFGEPIYGRFLFEWSSVLAIIVYSLIAWGIVRLITLTRPQEEI